MTAAPPPPTPAGPPAAGAGAPTATDTYLARYGVMRLIGAFKTLGDYVYQRHAPAIVRTERGLEVAQVLCPATPQALGAIPEPTRGQLARNLTPDDQKRMAEVASLQKQEFARGEELIRDQRLPMQLVEVEHLFGGERVVFYFLAETRVDFRELVKSLAREFRARIELRQIGVRDEAKLAADFGDCGKPVCCNTFMAVMPPVSMRMAKLQKSTLDPSKISGRCGRLKCCLRFEQDVYEEHEAELAPVGSRVVTTRGPGRVLAHEVLARRLLIDLGDNVRVAMTPAEILTVLNRAKAEE